MNYFEKYKERVKELVTEMGDNRVEAVLKIFFARVKGDILLGKESTDRVKRFFEIYKESKKLSKYFSSPIDYLEEIVRRSFNIEDVIPYVDLALSDFYGYEVRIVKVNKKQLRKIPGLYSLSSLERSLD